MSTGEIVGISAVLFVTHVVAFLHGHGAGERNAEKIRKAFDDMMEIRRLRAHVSTCKHAEREIIERAVEEAMQ